MAYKELVVLFLIVAFTTAQINISSSVVHTDDFIAVNKRQYADTIMDYDHQLVSFKDLYTGRIDVIDIQLDFLTTSIKHATDRLYTLELLSDNNKECANKYKLSLPEISATRAMVHNCSSTAYNQLKSLVAAALETRNALAGYYDSTLEQEIAKCGSTASSAEQFNYSLCVTGVISAATTYTLNNRKSFQYLMDGASCSANAYVKMALDCSFIAQSNAISLIAGTNTLIERCSQGADCTPCSGFYCENVRTIAADAVDYTNVTMANPFYNSKEPVSCLMLNVVEGRTITQTN